MALGPPSIVAMPPGWQPNEIVIRPMGTCSKLCTKAFELLGERLWWGLHDFVSPTTAATSNSRQFRERMKREVTRLRRQAIAIGKAVPWDERVDLGHYAGRGIQVMRVLSTAADDIEKLIDPQAPGRRRQYPRWRRVQRALRENGFALNEIVKLILVSDTDWEIPPCHSFVSSYQRASGERTGAGRLYAVLLSMEPRSIRG